MRMMANVEQDPGEDQRVKEQKREIPLILRVPYDVSTNINYKRHII